MSNKAITQDEIKILESQGCDAQDWSKVTVTADFDTSRLKNVNFIGTVSFGDVSGETCCGGIKKPCGIYNATIIDSTIGDNCRIANVGIHIANYDIANGVRIENVGTIQTKPDATFGNGTEAEILNEAGGREVILFNELSSQFAYLMCLHRYRPKMAKKLEQIAKAYTESVKSDRGKIDTGAKIRSVVEMIDVNVGAFAKINGASSLVNGTILSSEDTPTVVGDNVSGKNFIIAESSSVTSGAIVANSYIGQGCQVGKQYSAENCLLFANSEAFHGEGCSIFGGPYTVTHHKSSLLIAGMFSFYNAGSGTNMSNHMYKLGPVHEGKLERGTKTSSFSYMMWPCKVGPFSVVLGKHSANFDLSLLPFSIIDASSGKSRVVPGLNLITVGTIRDGAKWPGRDRRKGKIKRDKLTFDVFSPYSVSKMIRGSKILKDMQEATDKSIEEVSIGNAIVKRPILRTGQKFYRTGIEMYLGEKIFHKLEAGFKAGLKSLSEIMAADADAVYSEEWVDLSGQMMPRDRMVALQNAIESDKIADIESMNTELENILQAYEKDEWLWAKTTYKALYDIDLATATAEDIARAIDAYLKIRIKFLNLVLADAGKEFDAASKLGFGWDGTQEDAEKDFAEVRGTYDDNMFIKEMNSNIEDLKQRAEKSKKQLLKM